MKRIYKVELKGKGQLHEPKLKMERVLINLFSNSGTVWSNDDIELDVVGELELFMSCKALSGAEWEFSVYDTKKEEIVYEASGETGERLDTRQGRKIANYSEREVLI